MYFDDAILCTKDEILSGIREKRLPSHNKVSKVIQVSGVTDTECFLSFLQQCISVPLLFSF